MKFLVIFLVGFLGLVMGEGMEKKSGLRETVQARLQDAISCPDYDAQLARFGVDLKLYGFQPGTDSSCEGLQGTTIRLSDGAGSTSSLSFNTKLGSFTNPRYYGYTVVEFGKTGSCSSPGMCKTGETTVYFLKGQLVDKATFESGGSGNSGNNGNNGRGNGAMDRSGSLMLSVLVLTSTLFLFF